MNESRTEIEKMHATLRWMVGGVMLLLMLNVVLTVAILQRLA